VNHNERVPVSISKGQPVINPLRRRNRGLTPEQSEEVQKLVFELVRERLVQAFGNDGMWTVSMKDRNAVDSVFGETVAEHLAWDVAAQLAPQKKSRHQGVTDAKQTEVKPIREPATILPKVVPSPFSPEGAAEAARAEAAAFAEQHERLVA
jgi:hypothetical protein